MKILYDLTPTQIHTKYHGGAEYIKALFNILLESYGDNIEIVYYKNYKLDKNLEKLIEKYKISKNEVEKICEVKNLLEKKTYKIFYSGLPSKDLLKIQFDKLDIKFIFTIHGLRNIEMPVVKDEYKYCTTLKEYLISTYKKLFCRKYVKDQIERYKKFIQIKNKKILTVSKHSFYSLLETYPELKDEEISVYYSPLINSIKMDEILSKEKSVLGNQELFVKEYYLLMSGQVKVKNNIRAIEALDELFSEREINKKVLITGVNKKLKYKILKKIKNKEKFIILDYVDYLEMEVFLKNAFILIYPSLNEGFGYPPLQAMKYGTPVIASSFSAITEVCSNSALYFNPYSRKELKNRVIWMEEETEWKMYSQLGLENFRKIENQIKKNRLDIIRLFK